jgi:formylglycine-generating enzyme required for sulfatase activity
VYAVTGCTTASTSAGEKSTTIANINKTTANTAVDGVYTWDQVNGTKASSSGTIYGIYDLSGGTWERTAAYVANSRGELKPYGSSIAYDGNTLKTISTK